MKSNEINNGKPERNRKTNKHEPEAQPLTSNNWEDYTPFRNEDGDTCYCFLYRDKKLIVNRDLLDPDKDTPFAAAQLEYEMLDMSLEELLDAMGIEMEPLDDDNYPDDVFPD